MTFLTSGSLSPSPRAPWYDSSAHNAARNAIKPFFGNPALRARAAKPSPHELRTKAATRGCGTCVSSVRAATNRSRSPPSSERSSSAEVRAPCLRKARTSSHRSSVRQEAAIDAIACSVASRKTRSDRTEPSHLAVARLRSLAVAIVISAFRLASSKGCRSRARRVAKSLEEASQCRR